jgi:dephospho-CoA kinase
VLRVALTGGIACGKSVVGAMFARRGAHVVEADRIAHDLMRPGEKVYEDLVAHFGRGILDPDGTISRPKLAEAAFTTNPSTKGVAPMVSSAASSRVQELNRIVHPAVIRRQEEWMDEVGRRDPSAVAIVEAALIFEAKLEDRFDKIIVVSCGSDKKASRFAQRVSVTMEFARQEVERRSAAQISDEEKLRRADYVIHNDGPLEETEARVETVWRELVKLAAQ